MNILRFAFELFLEAAVIATFIAVTVLWCGLLSGVL